MAEEKKAEAGIPPLPLIGELINDATQGRVKYPTYRDDQKLGRTADKPHNGFEAAIAADVNNPDIIELVNTLLKKQADMRTIAVAHDMDYLLTHTGKRLAGLDSVKMTDDGKVAPGELRTSDTPTPQDVIAKDTAEHASPEKIKTDLAKRDLAEKILQDPHWLVAEAASNVSNAIRDAERNINGKVLSVEDLKIMHKGLEAEEKLEQHLVAGKPMSEHAAHKLEHQLEHAMDTAAHAKGIKLDDPAYVHYRESIHKGVDAGMEAIKKLHDAGVQPSQGESGMQTFVSAPKKDVSGKSPQ